MPGSCRQDDFANNLTGLPRIFFQVVGKGLRYRRMNRPHDLVVPEFGFGLAFELRFRHLDGDHRCESFPEVIARNIKFEFAG